MVSVPFCMFWGVRNYFKTKVQKRNKKSKTDFISEDTNKILGRTRTYEQSLIFN